MAKLGQGFKGRIEQPAKRPTILAGSFFIKRMLPRTCSNPFQVPKTFYRTVKFVEAFADAPLLVATART